MPKEFALALTWCLALSLVALAYGEYTSGRQSQGRPITVKERFRNLLILFAITVNVTVLIFMVWTQLPLSYIFPQLLVIDGVALSPLILWYLFAIPLRLVRYLSSCSRSHDPTRPHPLDGAWSPTPSFLDEIKSKHGQIPGAAADPAHTADPMTS